MDKILVDGIVGARPNMMKMAPLARAMAADGSFTLRLVHTGQHYDERMSEGFFRELGLPRPTFNLGVGSGSQGAQTARILEAYERILLDETRPRGVIVVGDVNSTAACALAASKLCLPVAHVEAGLRSHDRTMPEEINRLVTDTLSEVLLVSDPSGLVNLAREGHPAERIHFVGNIMMDTLLQELPQAEGSGILTELELKPREYAYVTLHRPSNVDDPVVLGRLVRVLGDLSRETPFIFPVHPRTRKKIEEGGLAIPTDGSLQLVEPLGYRANLRLMQCARAVLTDSGGVQEETSALNVPCLTLRDNTERPVTVELGSSELVGNSEERIRAAWSRLCSGHWKQASPIPLWDGRTAPRIVEAMKRAWL